MIIPSITFRTRIKSRRRKPDSKVLSTRCSVLSAQCSVRPSPSTSRTTSAARRTGSASRGKTRAAFPPHSGRQTGISSRSRIGRRVSAREQVGKTAPQTAVQSQRPVESPPYGRPGSPDVGDSSHTRRSSLYQSCCAECQPPATEVQNQSYQSSTHPGLIQVGSNRLLCCYAAATHLPIFAICAETGCAGPAVREIRHHMAIAQAVKKKRGAQAPRFHCIEKTQAAVLVPTKP